MRSRALSRFVLIYAPFAMVWIVGSDFLLAAVSKDVTEALWFSVLKGTLFVVVTTYVLDVVMRRTISEVEQRRALFRAVVEEAPDVILRATLVPGLRFDYVSPASTRILGYSPEEYYDDPNLVVRAVHPSDASTLTEILADPPLERTSLELRFLHKDDGSVVWTETDLTWETDEDGRPVGAVAVVRDISERKKVEARARLLATAVEAAGEAVMVTRSSGTIEYVNPRFEQLSGYDRAELIGENPRMLKSGRQNERFYARFWSTLRSGRTFRGRFVNRAKNGHLYEQQSTVTPVAGPGGEITHFVAVARDVTIEREIHRQIAATERSAAVAQLAAGMAHDFRNLLAVVSANLELLRHAGGGEPEVEEGLDDVERAVSSGADLVTRLLHLARPTETRLELTDLRTLVRGMEGIIRTAAARSIDVSLLLREDVLPVQVDRARIEQALLNMVRNACQAMPDGGDLSVRVERPARLPAHADPDRVAQSFVRLAVADTGVGMDAEALSRIYEAFYTTKESGTGLGVPMVSHAMEAHGGYLDFESEPGRGTVASMYFPAADERLLAEATDVPPSSAWAPHGTERLLVVDDDTALRRATERALTQFGYDVTTAEGGLAAIQLIEDGNRWDAILTDLVMPGLGGAELYHRLEERDIRIPLIFMSGHPPEHLDLTARSWPTGFLQKPWTLESLARTVRAVLDAP